MEPSSGPAEASKPRATSSATRQRSHLPSRPATLPQEHVRGTATRLSCGTVSAKARVTVRTSSNLPARREVGEVKPDRADETWRRGWRGVNRAILPRAPVGANAQGRVLGRHSGRTLGAIGGEVFSSHDAET